MDIHRCRFVAYPPSTINAIAFSHSPVSKNAKNSTSPRLAIGRANGDIEIWDILKGSWFQETIIRGGQDRSVDGLVWTQNPDEEVEGKIYTGKLRLFSIGYTTTVTEWDLGKGRPLRQASGNHGEIWCLAAQPPYQLKQGEKTSDFAGEWEGQNLITGCTDGAVVLYSTKDDSLELKKVLVRPSSKKAKIISVVFQNRMIAIAGCSDSTIRVFDTRNGALLRNMSLGSGPKGGPKETIVWSLKTLKGGNIVSGDSTGELKIWDGKTYTLMQRIKAHKQDILSLATSNDGSTILSGGMDRRTVIYKKNKRWEEISHRRYHTHDVKAMASFEGSGMSVVISGGPDAAPMSIPLGQHGFENQRALPFLPQETSVRSAPKKRLLMSWWDREVRIWRLNKPSKQTRMEEDDEPTSQNRKLVAKVLVNGEANITSAALSEDGSLLAVSTVEDVKVFQLRQRRPEDGDSLKVSKINTPSSFALGARLVEFSPDGKWLSIIQPDSHLTVARITSSASSSIAIHTHLSKLSRRDRHIEKLVTLSGFGSYNRTITQVAFSSDSRILAVGDLAGYIDTFVLSGQEDITQFTSSNDPPAASSESSDSESSEDEDTAKPKLIFGQHWTRNLIDSSIPKLPSAPTLLSFRPANNASQKLLTNGITPHPTRNNPHPIPYEIPTGEDRMLVMTSTSQIFEFEVLKGRLSPWSKRNPTAMFSSAFRRTRDQGKGAFWDVQNGKERVWIYGVGWLWMFDLSRDFPIPEDANEINIQQRNNATAEISAQPGQKRKRPPRKTTGAGNAIPDEKLDTGISRKMQVTTHEGTISSHKLHQPVVSDAMDIDDNEEDLHTTLPSSSLELLRRGLEPNQHRTEPKVTLLASGNGNENTVGDEDETNHEWHTYKYRPILGICVMGEAVDGLEVAIVERPIWEADLPPRYYGDQEWEKKDY